MYPSCVREFMFFVETKGLTELKEVTASEIIAYHEYLSQRPNQRRVGGLSDGMIRHHLCSLRVFFDYLLDIDVLQTSPARLPKFNLSKHKERNVLTLDEIKQLYSVCETKRDRLILSLAYGCGMRRSELENLDVGDVYLQKGVIVIRDSKNHRSRTIPVSDSVLKDLKEYIIYERSKLYQNRNQNNQTIERALILNEYGNRRTGVSIANRLKELIKKTQNAEILRKEITLHCLRHSLATHLLDKGATIEFVRDYLGHQNIDTTHIYAKRRKQRLKIISQIK